MWQKLLTPYIHDDTVIVIGVVQEQHPQRAKLYRQWRQLDWPIFVDSYNMLNVSVVPLPTAIDAFGIVRHASITPQKCEAEFLKQQYPQTKVPKQFNIASIPNIMQLQKLSEQQSIASTWRALGDALVMHADHDNETQAINAYRRAITLNPMDGRAYFRSGVALRRRFESPLRQPGDGQRAVEQWGHALDINPNQYIWRRRIQQYGPRLDKPYNFYYWIDQARSDIQQRGEIPVALPIEPAGSELASPSRPGRINKKINTQHNKDAPGRITRDSHHLVDIDTMITPAKARPGHNVRIRIILSLSEKKAVWNNEAEDLYVWLTLSGSMRVTEAQWTVDNPPQPESNERRVIDVELAIDPDMKNSTFNLLGYGLYYVCEKSGDRCQYLRQDFTVPLHIDSNATNLR